MLLLTGGSKYHQITEGAARIYRMIILESQSKQCLKVFMTSVLLCLEHKTSKSVEHQRTK